MPGDQLAGFWVEVALQGSRWLPNATAASFVVSPGIVNRAAHAFRDVAAVAACRVAAEDALHCLTTGTVGGVSEFKLQRSLKNMCKEGAYWGTAAGVYVATESVVEEMRGCTDWKNAVIGGAFAGALVSAATAGRNSHMSRGSKVVKDAIAGAAIAAAAEFIGRRSRVHLLARPAPATVVSSKRGIIGQTTEAAAAAAAGQRERQDEPTSDVDDDPWVSGSRGLELPLRFTSTGDSD